MKKQWMTPSIEVQQFEANEYVAACVVGSIACQYPGSDHDHVDDGTDLYVDSEGMWHGLCGNWADIAFSNETASGYEVSGGVTQKNRPIFGVSGYELAVGDYHVTWNSTDGAGTYTHEGTLKVTNIDNDRPNHS